MPRENLLIGGHDRLFVVFNILDGRLDVVWRETEEPRNLLIAPTGLEVVQHVIHRDARPGNFWPAAPINDGCAHERFSWQEPVCTILCDLAEACKTGSAAQKKACRHTPVHILSPRKRMCGGRE